MTTSRILHTTVAALAVVLCTSGCGLLGSSDSPGAADPAGAAPPPVAPPSSVPLTATSPENADRAAVELVWARFQVLYPHLVTAYPPAEWPARIADVAVDPIKTQVLQAAAENRRAGVVSYGPVVPHPYWQQPIGGKNTAVMRDCLDASRAGSMFSKTGYKRTVGVARSSIRAHFVKGGDGKWRVRQVEYHVEEKC